MKKLVIIILLTIVFNSLKSQNTPSILEFLNNTTISIDGTDYSLKDILDKNREIQIYADKLKSDLDSIKVELEKADLIIAKSEQEYKIQLERDSLQSQAFYLMRDKFEFVNKKLKKVNSNIKGSIGGGFTFLYNLDEKNISNVVINLNGGFLLQKKYLTSLNIGFSLNKEVLFGINESIIF